MEMNWISWNSNFENEIPTTPAQSPGGGLFQRKKRIGKQNEILRFASVFIRGVFLFCFRFPRSFDFHDLSWSTHSVLVVFRTFLSFNFSNAFLKMTVKIVEFSVGFRISSLLFFSLAIQGRFQFSFIDISANDKGPLFLIRIECWTQNDGSRTGLTFPSFVLVWFHIHDRFYDVSGTSMNTSEYFLGMSLRAFLVFMNNVSGFSSCLPVWGRGKKGEGKKRPRKIKETRWIPARWEVRLTSSRFKSLSLNFSKISYHNLIWFQRLIRLYGCPSGFFVVVVVCCFLNQARILAARHALWDTATGRFPAFRYRRLGPARFGTLSCHRRNPTPALYGRHPVT